MKDFSFFKLFFLLIIITSIPHSYAAPMGFVENVDGAITTNAAITPNGSYYYTTELENNTYALYAYSRNKGSGQLTLIQQLFADDIVSGVNGIDFYPDDLIVSPDNKQVYVSGNFGSNQSSALPYKTSILVFNIGATGLLSYQGRLPDVADDDMVITPDGHYIITGSQREMNVISRAQNGTIAYVSKINKDRYGNNLQYPCALTISPDGTTIYASSCLGQGHLYSFNLNKATGILTNRQAFVGNGHDLYETHPGEVVINGQGGRSSVVTKDGKFYYAVGGTRYETAKGAISVFKRGTDGALSFLKNIASPNDPDLSTLKILYSSDQYISLSPDQKFIYVGDRILKHVAIWRRNGTTGDLSYIGLVELDKDPIDTDNIDRSVWDSTISSDGRNLYIATQKGTTVFDLRSDLSIVKTGSSSVTASGVISYTLAVTNNGPSDAQNVIITDALPAGTSFISGTVNSPAGGCTASGLTVKCNLGSIFVNDGYNAVIKVRAPSIATTITNTASVKADQLDSNTTNSTDQATTTITDGGSTGGGGSAGGGTSGGSSSSGGGSLPVGVLVMLLPALLLRRRRIRAH